MNTFNFDKINKLALSLFGAVLANQEKNSRNIQEELKIFTDYNVIIVPKARYATNCIGEYILANKKTTKQLNATFYRSWNEVLSKSRFELLLDQIIHYATTYGTNFEGEVYVPASYFEIDLDSNTDKLPVTFINALTVTALAEKSVKLLSSGVALKQETVEDLLELLSEMSCLIKNADKITNKEAKIILADKYGLINVFNQSDLIRYFIFKATKGTLLIKNQKTIEDIIESKLDISDLLIDYGIEAVAESFNRYKPLYLAFKKAHINNATVINKISKLSKKLHKPMKDNPLNKISQDVLSKEDLIFIKDASLPALIRAYNAALLKSEHSEHSLFIVRNGKSWIKEDKNIKNDINIHIARINAGILKDLIAERLADKFIGKKFYIPQEIEYGLPLSEKQMCGNIPNNTIITTTDTLCVGAFWNTGYHVRDIDLSGISTSGKKYGWNGHYYSDEDDIIYSGDMTSPGPDGAVEYLTVRNFSGSSETEIVDVSINNYSGGDNEEYKFDIIVGITKEDDLDRKAMMNPADLIFSGERKAVSSGNSLGIIVIEGNMKKFIFNPSETSNLRVSRNNEVRQTATNVATLHKIKHSLTLNKLIEALGGEIVYNRVEGAIDLSPQKITKDFFNLFF